jgi:hypothetical protein
MWSGETDVVAAVMLGDRHIEKRDQDIELTLLEVHNDLLACTVMCAALPDSQALLFRMGCPTFLNVHRSLVHVTWCERALRAPQVSGECASGLPLRTTGTICGGSVLLIYDCENLTFKSACTLFACQ